MKLSDEKQHLLNSIVGDLKKVDGVLALVLGGSHATGMATERSDLDIGIYYSEIHPFSINAIKEIAGKFSIMGNFTVTGFYEWGPWVNGGAWIHTAHGKVDFLYRNLEHVATTIDKAKVGEWENNFEQQPPYGFSSLIYLGETKVCLPLYDPQDYIIRLKENVKLYPPNLKISVVQQSLWAAEFTIWNAERYEEGRDVYTVIGCLTRAVYNIVTALFALNEHYPLSDKRAIAVLQKSSKCPVALLEKIERILTLNGKTMHDNIHYLKVLFNETVELSDVTYKPYYKLDKI
jgi:hypothetical protein